MSLLKFDENKMVGSSNLNVSENDVESIIVNSFEGGSQYWLGVDNSLPEWKTKANGIPLSQWATKLLLEGKSIKLFDVEEEEDDTNWILTLDKLLKGIQLNAQERPFDSNLQNMDVVTADCIVQYAIFEDIVYS